VIRSWGCCDIPLRGRRRGPRNISPSGAFDAGKTMDQVLAIVNKTTFIRS